VKFEDFPADPREYLPLTERHCRRLGDHDPHYWTTPAHMDYHAQQTHWCPGTMIVEGGHG
jgi:hypothetical protein